MYGAHLAVYLCVAVVTEWGNPRFFAYRKIQSQAPTLPRSLEIRKSVLSLLFTSACFTAAVLIQRQMWAGYPWSTGIWPGIVGFVALTVAHDTWFYWGHRAMHTRPLGWIHKDHHKAKVCTAWSNDNMSLTEACLLQVFLPLAMLVGPVSVFTFWDRICGTMDPDYDARVRGFNAEAAARKRHAAAE